MSARILLVGCGKMGGALLEGWSKSGGFVVSTLDPHYADADYQNAAEISASYDVIVLAVKPQVMADVATSLRHLVKDNSLILSIAAGKTISFYEDIFGVTTSIIRAMPNTPALIGKGMSVLCANQNVKEHQLQLASNLMACVGLVEWLTDESLMDAVTAVSGSGPAYIFHLIEALTASGISVGLAPELAETLARQTVIGSAALAESQAGTPAATLRQNVTSPGGTTEAALKILMSDDGLAKLMTAAVQAATNRGKELSK